MLKKSKKAPSLPPSMVAVVALAAVGLVGAALVLAVVLDRAWVVELVLALRGGP